MDNRRKYDFKHRFVFGFSVPILLLSCGLSFAANDSDAILLQELKKRDAVIAQLLKRVEQLESRVRDTVVWVDAQPDGAVVMSQIDDLQNKLENLGPQTADAKAAQASAFDDGTKKKKKSGPGAVEVDEFAAERALERTLTNQGALLLPQGVYDIEPFFSYARRDTTSPAFADAGGGNFIAVGTQRIKRDAFSFGVGARIGLPYESQLELSFPYRVVRQERVVNSLSSISTDSGTGSSIGDASIGLAKTLMREDGWKPDLIGRVSWNTSTGSRSDNDIPLGIGFDELSASLTALKRQDPLAFTASLSYTKTLEKDDTEPGDQIGLSLGTSIAASPSTSLSFTLSQSWARETEINGEEVKGSSSNSSQFLIGFSSSVSRRALLAFSAGIGLTDDAPDYSFNVSMPIRFY